MHLERRKVHGLRKDILECNFSLKIKIKLKHLEMYFLYFSFMRVYLEILSETAMQATENRSKLLNLTRVVFIMTSILLVLF